MSQQNNPDQGTSEGQLGKTCCEHVNVTHWIQHRLAPHPHSLRRITSSYDQVCVLFTSGWHAQPPAWAGGGANAQPYKHKKRVVGGFENCALEKKKRVWKHFAST